MRILISVGDISSANYIYEIFKEIDPELEIYGITNKKLESIGIKSIANMEDISATGFIEVLPKLRKIFKVKKSIEKILNKMDVLIVCDAPSFNIPLIKKARKEGVKKIVYFISPQVWAWKEGRIRDIVEYTNHLIVILPFELEIYKKYESETFKVHYKGHPLVDIVKVNYSEDEFKSKLDIIGDLIGLFPGSRLNEILKMCGYYKEIYESVLLKDFFGVIPTFKNYEKYIRESFSEFSKVKIIAEDAYNLSYETMKYSKISLITSGTASLEAFLLGNPHIVFYRTHPITYFLAKFMVNVRYISLPNIIFGKEVIPELIQRDIKEAKKTVKEKLEDYRWQELVREKSEELKSLLGGKGTISRLRELFMEVIKY